MNEVCELCGKSVGLLGVQIKDGYVCGDCSSKLRGYLGKKTEWNQFTSQVLKDILENPLLSKSIRLKVNSGKKGFCQCCGKSEVWEYAKGMAGICQGCAMAVYTVEGVYNPKDKFDYSANDISWYQNHLSNCYIPRHDIVFNFDTKKVFFMDALTKKNYKIVPFEDLLRYEIVIDGNRFLNLDYRFNGATVRYHIDDSLETKEDHLGEFDKIVACLDKIDGLENISKNGRAETDINQNNAQVNGGTTGMRCPGCGGTNCTPIVESSTTGTDFSAGKGCCGAILFGPIGILCGACGKGKQVTSTTYWVCHNCGKKFQV